MTSSFIDAHCHLSDARVFDSAPELIRSAATSGVCHFVLAGVDPAEWLRQKELRLQFPKILTLNFGLHPWTVEKYSTTEISSALEKLRTELVHADGLGETGLDHGKKRDPGSFKKQENAFREQIRMAIEFSKPMVLHVVHAHEDAVRILKEEKASQVPMMVHSFSGNTTQLEPYLQLGAMISYSGSIVGEGYEKVKKALGRTPLDRLLLETDSPDQYWGEGENVPQNIAQVYAAAAQILDIPVQNLSEKVAANLAQIYYAKAL